MKNTRNMSANPQKPRQVPALLAGILVAVGLFAPNGLCGGEIKSPAELQREIADLVDFFKQIEAASPNSVERDHDGSVIAVRLPSDSVTEGNLRLISKCQTLRAL